MLVLINISSGILHQSEHFCYVQVEKIPFYLIADLIFKLKAWRHIKTCSYKVTFNFSFYAFLFVIKDIICSIFVLDYKMMPPPPFRPQNKIWSTNNIFKQ